MARIEDFKLEGGLSSEQMDLMHEKALWLTENVGIHIPHKGILDLLSNYDGVTIEGETVKFKAELVEKALKAARYPLPDYARGTDNWVISAGAHQIKVFDLETRKIRGTGMQDLIDMIKLGDALDTVGSAPVVPLDVPPHIAEILMHSQLLKLLCLLLLLHLPVQEFSDVVDCSQVQRYIQGNIWLLLKR